MPAGYGRLAWIDTADWDGIVPMKTPMNLAGSRLWGKVTAGEGGPAAATIDSDDGSISWVADPETQLTTSLIVMIPKGSRGNWRATGIGGQAAQITVVVDVHRYVTGSTKDEWLGRTYALVLPASDSELVLAGRGTQPILINKQPESGILLPPLQTGPQGPTDTAYTDEQVEALRVAATSDATAKASAAQAAAIAAASADAASKAADAQAAAISAASGDASAKASAAQAAAISAAAVDAGSKADAARTAAISAAAADASSKATAAQAAAIAAAASDATAKAGAAQAAAIAGVATAPITIGGTTDTVGNRLSALQSAQSAGSVAYDTLAQLNANLAPVDGSTGQVVNDGTNNGFYAKSGASGAGSWFKKSGATVPALDTRAAALEGVVQITPGTVTLNLLGNRASASAVPNPTWAEAWADPIGNLAGGIGVDGTLRFAFGQFGALAATSLTVGSFSLLDNYGGTLFSVGSNALTQFGLTAISAVTGTGYREVDVDPAGNIGGGVDATGKPFGIRVPVPTALSILSAAGAAQLAATSAGVTVAGLPSLAAVVPGAPIEVWADLAGNIGLGLDANGLPFGKLAGSVSTTGYTAQEIALRNNRQMALSAKLAERINPQIAKPIWAFTHFFSAGQSLSTGVQGYPALSTTAKPGNLMIGQSQRPAGANFPTWAPIGASALNPLVATVEQGDAILTPTQIAALASGSQNPGEGPLNGFANLYRDLWNADRATDNDTARSFIYSACGVGGTTIEQNAQASWEQRFTDAAAAAKALAGSASYGIGAILFLQGEANYQSLASDYQAKLLAYRNDLIAKVMAVSGQTTIPAWLSYQTKLPAVSNAADGGPAIAQLSLSNSQANWFLVSPVYYMPGREPHRTCNGYRWLGAQFAKVYRRVARGEAWKPLQPVQATYRGQTALITFHVPEPPLQIGRPFSGETQLSFPTDYGITALDSLGQISLTATLAGDVMVQLALGRAPVGYLRLRYADPEYHQGAGALMDSDPTLANDLYVYADGTGQDAAENIASLVGKPYPLNNWCVAFDLMASNDAPN